MPRIQILSDLHLEFHKDNGEEFIQGLRAKGDILVLAGDICSGRQLPGVLRSFCQKYTQVILVHGNHEFYGSTRKQVIVWTRQACKENPNLSWLDNTGVEIGGVQFLGTPLWFKEAPLAPKWELNDFEKIKDYETWVYTENRKAIVFLSENVQPGDVVITHHLPSRKSIHRQFKRSPLNAFFLCDVEPLIVDRQPALWVHGHTHSSSDYRIGQTRVLCNPMGYGQENAKDFDEEKCVEPTLLTAVT